MLLAASKGDSVPIALCLVSKELIMGVVPQVRFSLRKITATIVTCSIPHIALSIPLTHVQHIGNDEIGLTNTEALTLFQAAVTTDKKFVYANSFTGGAIVVFERDTATGLYSVAGVTREDTVLRTGNHNPERLVLSPDNGHLYVLGLEPGFGELRADGNRTTDSAISVFDRDPETGLLTQLDNNAADTDLTYEGRGLAGAYRHLARRQLPVFRKRKQPCDNSVDSQSQRHHQRSAVRSTIDKKFAVSLL